MTPYLLIAFSALLLAIGSTPVMRRLALRYAVVDAPSGRKIHAAPVPLLGGAAIYISFVRGAHLLWRPFLYQSICGYLCRGNLHQPDGGGR